MTTAIGYVLATAIYLLAGISHAFLLHHYEHFGQDHRGRTRDDERAQLRFIVIAWPIVLIAGAFEIGWGDS